MKGIGQETPGARSARGAPAPPRRRLACGAAALLAGAMGVTTLACGGTISEQAYERLATAVDQRNAARHRAARAAFEAKGWRYEADRDVLILSAAEETRGRCLERAFATDGADGGEAELAELRMAAPTSGAELRADPVALTAPLAAACAFLRRSNGSLIVTRPDGTTGTLVSVAGPRTLARHRTTGQIVRVDAETRVVSRRTVRVERTCNLMPRVEPDPLERFVAMAVVWAPMRPLPTERVTVEREELDVECTHETH